MFAFIFSGISQSHSGIENISHIFLKQLLYSVSLISKSSFSIISSLRKVVCVLSNTVSHSQIFLIDWIDTSFGQDIRLVKYFSSVLL